MVNVCKKKHMTNTRASGSDDALRLIPPKVMSLEQAIEFIAEDELIEVTPKNIRMRKRILDKSERMEKAYGAKIKDSKKGPAAFCFGKRRVLCRKRSGG